MLCKVFIFGRPGSGKSMAVRLMASIAQHRGWKVELLRDYDILYKMFCEDLLCEKFKPVEYDGFDVVEFSVLLEALDQLKRQIIARQSEALSEDLLFIELARDDYNHVLNFFSQEDRYMLQNSYVIFVNSDIEKCIQRIYERVQHHPNDGEILSVSEDVYEDDHHFVSEHILRTYYQQQNFDTNLDYPVRTHTFDNNGTREEFCKLVNRYIETLLAEQTEE